MTNPSDTPTGDALHSGIKRNRRIVHGHSLAMGWIFECVFASVVCCFLPNENVTHIS